MNTQPKLGLVLEYVNGPTLDMISTDPHISFAQKLVHLIDLVSVIKYIHSLKIIHRDLKPNNIIINDNLDLKLLDYGISKIANRTQTTTLMRGTVLYMAPENFVIPDNFDPVKKVHITNKVDIWAIGCIINELFTGEKPWIENTYSDNQIIVKLFQKEEFPVSSNLNNCYLKYIVEKCTDNDPTERPDCDFIISMLLKLIYNMINKNGLDYILGENIEYEKKSTLFLYYVN